MNLENMNVNNLAEVPNETRKIEVFVESSCRSCEAVLHVLRGFIRDKNIEISLHHRGTDSQVFQARKISITPATFIDGKLAFYGEFSAADLRTRLERVSITNNQ